MEKKIFEIVDNGRTKKDAGRTPDHGHLISSPCEPNGSGERAKNLHLLQRHYCSVLFTLYWLQMQVATFLFGINFASRIN